MGKNYGIVCSDVGYSISLVTSYSTTVNEVSIFSTELEQWTQFYSKAKYLLIVNYIKNG